MLDKILSWAFGDAFVPVLILILFLAMVAAIRLFARNYRVVQPNEALVVSGRRGFRIVTGGAILVWPIIQRTTRLELNTHRLPIEVSKVPSKLRVPVTVEAVATVRISESEEGLRKAATRFGTMDMPRILETVKSTIEGGLRGVVATLMVEQLIEDRVQFASTVLEHIAQELSKLGIVADNLLIQQIKDDEGYIEALGKKQTADVKRDAEIALAEAHRDQEIRVAQANRDAAQQASEARRIGETAKAAADQAISDANRQKDLRIAENTAQVQGAQARIPIVRDAAAAEEQRNLNVKEVEALEARVIAETELQQRERERKDAELRATVVVQAEREREAIVIRADAEAQATVRTAEGQRRAVELKAEADRIAREQSAQGGLIAAEREATGRKAQAEAARAELVAMADGDKAKRLAVAEGNKATLLAEAEGTLKKAEAYRALEAAGRLLEVLKTSPEVIEALGKAVNQAGAGTVVPMAEAIGRGLGNIKDVRLFDFGGGDARNAPLTRFANFTPELIFRAIQQLQAVGLWDAVTDNLKKVGIDLSSVLAERPAVPAPAGAGKEKS